MHKVMRISQSMNMKKADLPRDGKIVREDGQVRTQKAAISYVWNLPRLAQRLDMPEEELREALYKYLSHNLLTHAFLCAVTEKHFTKTSCRRKCMLLACS